MADSVGSELEKVLYSGYIGEGAKVLEFEQMLRDTMKIDHLLTLNSCTAALQLAYHMSVNRYPEAEVITTPITCTATNTPIVTNNAKIVWADVDPVTGSIDPGDIEKKITKKTRAITMVHWGGNPCDIVTINALADTYNIKVVEDAAHSWGSTYDGHHVGTHSDFACFSLQAIKHITSIDGGVLTCRNNEDYARGKLLRWFGIDREVREGIDLRCEIDVAEAGYKAHMNDVNATVGIENYKHAPFIISKHRDNARFYNEAFIDCKNITLVPENPRGESAYWLYTIHVSNRDELMYKLKERGVMSSKVHARNDTHSMFREFRCDLPNATKFNDTHLCLPVGWWVSKEDLEYIVELVIKYAK